jgi:hypothetical protein
MRLSPSEGYGLALANPLATSLTHFVSRSTISSSTRQMRITSGSALILSLREENHLLVGYVRIVL